MASSLLDTIKIVVDCDHRGWLENNQQQHDLGVKNVITKATSSLYKKINVPGAYGARAEVKSVLNGTKLVIECSAPKFLTGQNVFGSEELQPQVLAIVKQVCKYLVLRLSPQEWRKVEDGLVAIHRVDVVGHLKMKNREMVGKLLRNLKMQIMFLDKATSNYKDQTLYIDQNSDWKSLKFYGKAAEINYRPLNESLPHREFIERYCEDLFRLELVLRRRFLKAKGIKYVRDWTPKIGRSILRSDVIDLGLTDVSLKHFEHHPNMGSLQNCILALHAAGVDLRTVGLTQRQLKTHATTIRNKIGLNINVPRSVQLLSDIPVRSLIHSLRFGKNRKAIELGVTKLPN